MYMYKPILYNPLNVIQYVYRPIIIVHTNPITLEVTRTLLYMYIRNTTLSIYITFV